MKNNKNKRSVVYSWAVSYIAILAVVLVIFVFVFSRSVTLYSSEIEKSNEYIMDHAKTNIDAILNELRKAGTDIWLDTKLMEVFSYNSELTDQNYYDIHTKLSKLRQMQSSTNIISSITLIDVRQNRVFSTTSGIVSLKTFYDANVEDLSDFNEWQKIFSKRSVEEYYASQTDDTSANQISYIRSLSKNDPKSLSTCVIITMNRGHLQNQLNAIKHIAQNDLYIIDSDGNSFASTNDNIYTNINLNEFRAKKGNFKARLNSKNYVVTYSKSEANNWIYLGIGKETQYMQNIFSLQLIFIWAMLFAIIISGIIARYFIKRNYSSLFKLLNMFKIGNKGQNEYDVLTSAIKDTLHINDALNKQVDNQNNILRNRFFEQLLKRQIRDEILPISELMHLYDIELKGNDFIIMLFFVDENTKNAHPDETYSYSQTVFIISNVVEELVGKHHLGIMVECEEFIACIVNINSQRKISVISDLIKVSEEAEKFVNENFNISFDVAISSVYSGLENSSDAYDETLEVMKHKRVLGIKKTTCYDEIKGINSNSYYYPFRVEQQLSNIVKIGNASEAISLIEEVFNKNLENKVLSIELAQFIILNVISTIIRTTNELSGSLDKDFLDGINLLGKFNSEKPIEEMKRELYEFLSALCTHIIESKKLKENWIKTDVLPYIAENYKNINLSASMIADEFSVHPVYISRLFKEQLSEGMLEYISKLRIEKSKKILIETALSLDEISELVGYATSRTYSRIFKKIEGVTPGRYREIHTKV